MEVLDVMYFTVPRRVKQTAALFGFSSRGGAWPTQAEGTVGGCKSYHRD